MGFSILLGLQFGLLSQFFPNKKPLSWLKILQISSVWFLFEWSRLFFLTGFAWNQVGFALASQTTSAQLASIVGIYGLSWVVIAVNLLGLNFLSYPSKLHLARYLCILTLPYAYGYVHINVVKNLDKPVKELRVALVQTGILPDEKAIIGGRENKFISPINQWRLLLSCLEKCDDKSFDLIVLPECALPFEAYSPVYPISSLKNVFPNDLATHQEIAEKGSFESRGGNLFVSNVYLMSYLANHFNSEVIAGLEGCEKDKYFNSAFHFMPNIFQAQRYDKRALLPFAEYLPLKSLKFLTTYFGLEDFFSFGSKPVVSNGMFKTGLSICYDECIPSLIRQTRREGAEIIVNVTNDGWYPDSLLPEQHLAHGRLRAIENGIPILRACNTGVTSAINQFGEVLGCLGTNTKEFNKKKGILDINLHVSTYRTIYTFVGDVFYVVLCSICALLPFKRVYT